MRSGVCPYRDAALPFWTIWVPLTTGIGTVTRGTDALRYEANAPCIFDLRDCSVAWNAASARTSTRSEYVHEYEERVRARLTYDRFQRHDQFPVWK
jgi:hypothetical protein